jgi:hypothetical protein
VHLVLLRSGTSLVLQDEIARKGELLFTRDRNVSDSFLIKALQMLMDLMQTRRMLEDQYIKDHTS